MRLLNFLLKPVCNNRGWTTIIGLVASLLGGQASQSAADTNAAAVKAGQPYKPVYSGQADQLLYQLIQQQAATPNNYGQYQGTSDAMTQQYYNMMGLPYTSPGSYAQGTPTQTLNPAYTAYMAAQKKAKDKQEESGSGGWFNMFGLPSSVDPIGNTLDNLFGVAENTGEVAGAGGVPAQYLTTYGQGAYTPGVTTQPTGPNYNALLGQYLDQSFKPLSSDLYKYYQDQVVQGARGGLTARGLNTSPYGAGIESEATTSFANQQLMNQLSNEQNGLSAYMSGQQGMMGIGQGALNTALQLEALKNEGNPAISNLKNYLGMSTNSGALAATSAALGQIQSAGNQQGGQALSQLGSNYLTQGLDALLNKQTPAVQATATGANNLGATDYTANWNPSTNGGISNYGSSNNYGLSYM